MKHIEKATTLLRTATNIIAILIAVILIISAAIITIQSLIHLQYNDPRQAIIDSLFVVILLELFYAIRSFINRGSMNAGIIINVGVIVAIKELIFDMSELTLEQASTFGIIFLSLGGLYLFEIFHYEKKKTRTQE